ncbi:MAG: tetratricopeptide repeat protein [Candidatus Electrothrix sp. AX2]|nr:tetratricopeptide repeat protein [Candidatus Electrothrix gigas]
MNLAGFEKIAPYLGNPLILVGFVLMLAYGIHWQLMKSGLLRQVSQRDSSLIIRLFLRYGFWLALVLLLAGVGLQFSDRAFMNSPQEALVHYRKAVQLDPDNAEGWNQLGNLLLRTGKLAQAEEAFHKVLALAEAHQDQEKQAMALGNLGLVHETRGELDKAEEIPLPKSTPPLPDHTIG